MPGRRRRMTVFSRRGVLARAYRLAVAGSAARLRELEHSVPSISPLGKDGRFREPFKAMSSGPDLEHALINGTIVQVHQKARGAKEGLSIKPSGARAAALRPRGVALMDVPGHLVRFLLPRRALDMKGVAPLLRDVPFGALLADGLRRELALEDAGHARRKCRDPAEIQPKAAARL